jgi:hypothetical protein
VTIAISARPERDRTYTFEVSAYDIQWGCNESSIRTFHLALAQAAMEAVRDGIAGYSVQEFARGPIGFVRVTVPAQVAGDGRWLWRRSVI